LRFHAGFVYEDSCVGVEAREGERDMVVHEADLRGSDACVLQLHSGALFAAEDDDIGAFDADGAGSWDGVLALHHLGSVCQEIIK
jgi:hypothetical protein